MPEPRRIDPLSCRPSYLRARAVIGRDLYAEGRITHDECLRLERDCITGVYTGPVEYVKQWGKARKRSEED